MLGYFFGVTLRLKQISYRNIAKVLTHPNVISTYKAYIKMIKGFNTKILQENKDYISRVIIGREINYN